MVPASGRKPPRVRLPYAAVLPIAYAAEDPHQVDRPHPAG